MSMTMTPELNGALAAWLLAAADDQLILAHRASEWTGHGPILEEDIAIANIAQDALGHATLWYDLLAELQGEDDEYPDRLVYRRGPTEWRNAQLVELPNGDWAFTMLRQYFMDVYGHFLLQGLTGSRHPRVAAVAAKIQREKLYHLKHSSAWFKRLALGTEESHRRTQTALDQQWPYVFQLFQPQTGDARLVEAGIIPAIETAQAAWEGVVRPALTEGQLKLPARPSSVPSRAEHTAHLTALLDDLQKVARLDPQAAW